MIDGRQEEHIAARDKGLVCLIKSRFDDHLLEPVGKFCGVEPVLQITMLIAVNIAHRMLAG